MTETRDNAFNSARDNIDGLLGHIGQIIEDFSEVWVTQDNPMNVQGALSANNGLWMVQKSLRKFWYRFELAYSKLMGDGFTLDDACRDVMTAIKEESENIDNGVNLFKRVIDGDAPCGIVSFDLIVRANEVYDKMVGIPRRVTRIYDGVENLLNGRH